MVSKMKNHFRELRVAQTPPEASLPELLVLETGSWQPKHTRLGHPSLMSQLKRQARGGQEEGFVGKGLTVQA